MRKYRKKPVVVEASQWFRKGDHPHVVRNEIDGQRTCEHCGKVLLDHGRIATLEGTHIVCPGDFVITGIKNEHYPCKPDIFEATYELVDEG